MVNNELQLSAILLNLEMMWLIIKRMQKLKKQKRQWWVHPLNVNRANLGQFFTLFQELKKFPTKFQNYIRMSKNSFDKLLEEVTPHLMKRSYRRPISPEERLVITLRYLATGDDVTSLSLQFRVGKTTYHDIINETCYILAEVLKTKYLEPPDEEQWKRISEGFYEHWNMPHCIGAIDGKHVEIVAPPNSGSMCFNYKKSFSTVLLAVCDHQYKFTLVDVGSYGSESDGGIFFRSAFGQALENDELNLPKERVKLPGSDTFVFRYLVGDEAFKISRHMMRPYPGQQLSTREKVFNYRLSRARRTIENSFGILTSKWRVMRKPIHKSLDNAQRIISACIVLHNFIITHDPKRRSNIQNHLIDLDFDSEIESSNVPPLSMTNSRQATIEAHHQRDQLCLWFMSPAGEVPWQLEFVNRGQHGDNEGNEEDAQDV